MNAVFVISAPFPYGAAFSSRARNLTKILCLCGFHVTIIAPESRGKETSEELNSYDVSVVHIYDPQSNVTLSGIGTAKPYMNAIYEYLNENTIDLLVSSSMVFVADKLLRLAKKMNIPYIIEQCEWYDSSTFKFGKWNLYFREHIRRIEKKNKKVDGVIAISRLFEQHYFFLGVPTIRIPTILDITSINYRNDIKDSSDYHIVFAGSLGKGKEKMAPIFQALAQINMFEKKILLDIYGPTKEEILHNIENNVNLLERVRPYVNIHGYIQQDKVELKMREADFTIFTRPLRRSSNAGFPTKLAESMAVGTPVIANDTGDISLFLKDGKNGILLKDGSEQEVLYAFEKILLCTGEEHINMRKNARRTAEKYFDFSNYVNEMRVFLDRVK